MARRILSRRHFAASVMLGPLYGGAQAQAMPWQIGHRQASMTNKPGPEVFQIARRIPGLSGVELQVHFQKTTLWDRETLLSYKRGADNTGMKIPSLAGVWTGGASLLQPALAEETLRKSIQAAEALGAKVILVAAFNNNCPKMDQEDSYEPVVLTLQKVAEVAAGAGVTIGLETSLSPADDKKLVDLVNRPAIKVYYDADNVERFGHKEEAITGYSVLGRQRIAMIHLKNGSRLLEEPGRVNWSLALQQIRRIGYDGWLVFETSHSGPEQCIEATKENIEFIRTQWARR